MAGRIKINKKHALTVKFAACVLVEKNNKLLLLKRFNTGYKDGDYAFPAGHVEDNETYRQAAVRELKEESNLSTKESFLELVHVIDVSPKSSQLRYIYFFFKCKKWSGKVKNNEPDKCDDIGWFNKKNLPDNFSHKSLQGWKNIQKGIYYSEWGWKK